MLIQRIYLTTEDVLWFKSNIILPINHIIGSGNSVLKHQTFYGTNKKALEQVYLAPYKASSFFWKSRSQRGPLPTLTLASQSKRLSCPISLAMTRQLLYIVTFVYIGDIGSFRLRKIDATVLLRIAVGNHNCGL